MSKLVLSDLASLENQASAIAAINNNNAAIEDAFDNSLSRNGLVPNHMTNNLDMNSNRIINLPAPTQTTEPLRLTDLDLFLHGTATFNTATAATSITYQAPGTGSVQRTLQTRLNEVVYVKDYGALWDGVTDDTVAVTNAIAALPAAGGTLMFPAGTGVVSQITINKPGIYQGMGMAGGGGSTASTVIKGNSAANPVVSITALNGGVALRDMGITSSIAAGSRTGPGVKVNAGGQVELCRIYSTGHKYGFLNETAGVYYCMCNTSLNNSHGFYLNGAVSVQNEVSFVECQSSSNTGDGFRIDGQGTGIYFYRPISAGNTGNGIKALKVGSGIVNDVHITNAEISGNLNGFDWSSNSGGTTLTIVGGLIEVVSGTAGVWIGPGFTKCCVAGITFQEPSTVGVYANGTNTTITGNIFQNQSVTDVRLGASSVGAVITGNRNNNQGGPVSAVGITIDGGAAAFTATGNDFSDCTTKISGTIPSGSALWANKGIDNTTAQNSVGTTLQLGTTVPSGNNIVDVSANSATGRFIQIDNTLGTSQYGVDAAGTAYAWLAAGTGGTSFGTATNCPTDFYSNGLRRVRIDGAGNIVPGTGALTTTATDGFVYIESCAGAPTGVPTTYAGRVATIYDTTNNKLYVYNGAWKSVTLA